MYPLETEKDAAGFESLSSHECGTCKHNIIECNLYMQYLPAEISRLEIRTWWDYRPWLWPRALLKQQPRENAPSIPEVVETPR